MTECPHCGGLPPIVGRHHVCLKVRRVIAVPDPIRDVGERPIADLLVGALWSVGKAKDRLREQLGP